MLYEVITDLLMKRQHLVARFGLIEEQPEKFRNNFV